MKCSQEIEEKKLENARGIVDVAHKNKHQEMPVTNIKMKTTAVKKRSLSIEMKLAVITVKRILQQKEVG
jgi:hypothetical protein